MQITVKLNYIVFSLITLAISLLSRYYASSGMRWYYTLNLPSYTPPSWVIGSMWSLIYVLCTIAVIMVWNNFKRDRQFFLIMALFAINAFFNVLWTYLFFYKHSMSLSFAAALAVAASLLALIVAVGQRSLFVAGFLVPYLAWITFAVWLNFMVWVMN